MESHSEHLIEYQDGNGWKFYSGHLGLTDADIRRHLAAIRDHFPDRTWRAVGVTKTMKWQMA